MSLLFTLVSGLHVDIYTCENYNNLFFSREHPHVRLYECFSSFFVVEKVAKKDDFFVLSDTEGHLCFSVNNLSYA